MPIDAKANRPTRFGELYWCGKCQFGFPSVLPTTEEIIKNYTLEQYYTQNESHIADISPTLIDRIVTKLAYTADRGENFSSDLIRSRLPEGGTAVEIGCGGGNSLKALQDAGFDVVGVEPDEKARAVANEAGYTVHAGTGEDIPAEISPFSIDLVLMSHSLEHCVDPVKAVQNVADILSPEGTFLCEVPNCGAQYFQDYAQISEMLDVPRHLYFFTKASLEKICDMAGLEIVEWYYNGYTRHYIPGWQAWENAIHDRITSSGHPSSAPRRTFTNNLKTLMKSAFVKPEQKYDCIGFFARKKAT